MGHGEVALLVDLDGELEDLCVVLVEVGDVHPLEPCGVGRGRTVKHHTQHTSIQTHKFESPKINMVTASKQPGVGDCRAQKQSVQFEEKEKTTSHPSPRGKGMVSLQQLYDPWKLPYKHKS